MSVVVQFADDDHTDAAEVRARSPLGDASNHCPIRSVQGLQSQSHPGPEFSQKQAEDWRTCCPLSMTSLAFAHHTNVQCTTKISSSSASSF
jgi:hypothetical protein